jgi:hypothetical protein
MHPASTASFQALGSKFESQWAPQMMANLGIDTACATDHLGSDFL